eukprot:TRINITY_DN10475_c0_g1_i1.p1 TRINITY_DN10475_c0_g1~~TRINITY_DN10475_c0_g1_i1.p1  ORF type:complete len:1344 (+),score=264.20 TRINITY_DN10475_c0_g1_i1:27-4034(+)
MELDDVEKQKKEASGERRKTSRKGKHGNENVKRKGSGKRAIELSRYREFSLTASSEDECSPLILRCTKMLEEMGKLWHKFGLQNKDDDAVELVETMNSYRRKFKYHAALDVKRLRQLRDILAEYRRELREALESGGAVSRQRMRKLMTLHSRIQEEFKRVLPAEDELVPTVGALDAALSKIEDPAGRAFWKESFSGMDVTNISWGLFYSSLQKEMQGKGDLTDREERLFQRFIDYNMSDYVSPHEFNSFLKAFGPFAKCLENVRELISHPWWHGFLTAEESLRLLVGRPQGTFLVRFSRSRADSFALEYVIDKKANVKTVLIRGEQPKGVSIDEEGGKLRYFPRISDFVAKYAPVLTKPFTVDFIRAHWFFGSISSQEACGLLAHKPIGTFLVHFNPLDGLGLNLFLITYVGPDGYGVVALEKVPAGYKIAPYEYKDEFTTAGSTTTATTNNTTSPGTTNSPSTSPSLNAGRLAVDDKSAKNRRVSRKLEVSPKGGLLNKRLNEVRVGGIKRGSSFIRLTSEVYSDIATFLRSHTDLLKYNYSEEGIPKLKLREFKGAGKALFKNGQPPPKFTPDQEWSEVDSGRSVPVYEVLGPTDDNTRLFLQRGTHFAAETVANYPRDSGGWRVICDTFRVKAIGNRTLFALADGCNWGPRPRAASEAAGLAVMEYLSTPHVQLGVHDSLHIRHHLLYSFIKAHDRIVAGADEQSGSCGTTTLLAGMLFEVNEPFTEDEWAFVCTSVGDCKAFHWCVSTQKVTEITYGNRQNARDAKDCGGRLGPYLRGGSPDLRNLGSFFWPCRLGDIVIVCSDGVHDNLDAEHLGKVPRDLGMDYDTWDDCPNDEIEEGKGRFACELMESLLGDCTEKTSAAFTRTLIEHALSSTSKTLKYMEDNPTLPEPADYRDYPGKMDHTTCVCMKVGEMFDESEFEDTRAKQKKIKRGGKPKRTVSLTPVADKIPQLTDNLHQIYLRSFADDQPLVSLRSSSGVDSRLKYNGQVSSHVTSTFPPVAPIGTDERHHDPSTPHYSVVLSPNRIVVALAGTSQFGKVAEAASNNAVSGFMKELLPTMPLTKDTKAVAATVLQAIDAAHRSILEPHTDVNTSFVDTEVSFLGGVACRLPSLEQDQLSKWVFVCVNVGENKAFHWSASSRTLTDITARSLMNKTSDFGGKIGTNLFEGGPDLSNLNVYSQTCSESGKDVILLLSPGIYLNFDPLFLGLKPRQVREGLKKPKWEKVPDGQQIRADYRTAHLNTLLNSLNSDDPDVFTTALIAEAHSRTQHRRSLIASAPDSLSAITSSPYTKYPGLLGHTCCVAFTVDKLRVLDGAGPDVLMPSSTHRRKK